MAKHTIVGFNEEQMKIIQSYRKTEREQNEKIAQLTDKLRKECDRANAAEERAQNAEERLRAATDPYNRGLSDYGLICIDATLKFQSATIAGLITELQQARARVGEAIADEKRDAETIVQLRAELSRVHHEKEDALDRLSRTEENVAALKGELEGVKSMWRRTITGNQHLTGEVDRLKAELEQAREALRRIQAMAAEDIRTDEGAGGAIFQIEADARAALPEQEHGK